MSLGTLVKDPQDVRIYTVVWTTWLANLSTTISTSTWIVPTGLTSVIQANTTTTTSIKISGGSNGRIYSIANRILTASGETKQVSFDLLVETQ